MRSILAPLVIYLALAVPAMGQDKAAQVQSKELTADTLKWFDSNFVISTNEIDDSDWTEILARWGQVLLGDQLSPAARKRTIAQANSTKPSKIKAGPFSIYDTGPFKRILCVVIVKLDDQIANKQTIQKMEERIKTLEILAGIQKP